MHDDFVQNSLNMRIVLMDWVLDPAKPGASGLSDIIWETARELCALGDDVHIVGAYDALAPLPNIPATVHRVHRPKWWRRNIIGQILTCLTVSRAAARIPGVRIVYAADYIAPAVMNVCYPKRSVTFTTPGNIFERIENGNPFDWSTTQVYKIAALITARRAAHVVAVSRDMRSWWLRTGTPTNRISVLPWGVDTQLFSPDPNARPRLGIPEDEESVVSIGRLSVEKNIDTVIRAFADVASNRPRARLHIIGRGPEETRLRSLVNELGIDGRVSWLNWLDRAKVPDYYRIADVFVLPSTSEPLARTLLEAMSCGTFIVASNSSGTPDAVIPEVNGLLVPPRDVGAWQAAIERALQNPDWRRARGAEGRKMACEKLAWPIIARRLRDEVFRVATSPSQT